MKVFKLAALAMSAAFAATASRAAPPAALPGEASALVQALDDAYARAEAKAAGLPRAKDDGEMLVRLLDVDQAGWAFATSAEFSRLPPEQAAPARALLEAEVRAHDRADEAKVMAMTPEHGWFTSDRYGLEGANAALLILQHAENPDLLRDVIERVQASSEQAEIKATAIRILQDRLKAALDRAPEAREAAFAAAHGGGGSGSISFKTTRSESTNRGATSTAVLADESRSRLCPTGLSPLAVSPQNGPGLLLCIEPKPAAPIS